MIITFGFASAALASFILVGQFVETANLRYFKEITKWLQRVESEGYFEETFQ